LDIPEKPSTSTAIFTFSGWDTDFTLVQTDLTIKAQFAEETRLYEVIFIDGNGRIFDKQYIEYEKAATAPGIPRKAAFGDYAYRFTGWIQDFSNITCDIVVNSRFEKIDRYYTVTFINYDNTILKIQEGVEYLSSATPPEEVPPKPSTEQYVYAFNGWDKDYTAIEGDSELVAQFTESLHPFTVIFLDGNGNVFAEQIVLWGQDGTLPEGTPCKDKDNDYIYTFSGWERLPNNIKENTTIGAVFSTIDRYYCYFLR